MIWQRRTVALYRACVAAPCKGTTEYGATLHSLSRAQIGRWHKLFLVGIEHVEDEHTQGGFQFRKRRQHRTCEGSCEIKTSYTLRMISGQFNFTRFTNRFVFD